MVVIYVCHTLLVSVNEILGLRTRLAEAGPFQEKKRSGYSVSPKVALIVVLRMLFAQTVTQRLSCLTNCLAENSEPIPNFLSFQTN